MSLVDLRARLAQRLWAYQAERFPVFKHGLVIAAFALAAVGLPAALNGAPGAFDADAALVGVAVTFLAFLQLRIADEHKDFNDDRRYRPERPVPRGLVHLSELRLVAIAAAAIQGLATWMLNPSLLTPLALVWVWMALMTAEFLAPEAVKARPLLYMASHMLVMPLIALFGIACGWVGAHAQMTLSPPVAAFLMLAFTNGVVIEIARKCWAPQDERGGVATYSKLWGPLRAAIATATAIALGSVLAVFALQATRVSFWFGIATAVFACLGMFAALAYAANPTPRRAKLMESGASLWVLVSYVLLGAAPLAASLPTP